MSAPRPQTEDRAPRGLLPIFTRHATLANLVLAVMIVTGLFAAPRMRAQFFPDTVIQQITIAVAWPGAGAEDVDASIVEVLEPAAMGVEGVTSVESRATEGAARLSVEFEPGWDMGRAVADMETAILGAGELPEDAEDPDIIRGAWSDRVADLVISGPVALQQLGQIGDDITAKLYQRGITRVTPSGISAPETRVTIRPADLERHNVTMGEIAGVIGAAASALPAGDVASGTARVRTGTAARSPDEVAALVLRAGADGAALRVGDVADVTDAGADRVTAYYVGENPAIMLNIVRSAAGDAIGMQREVEAIVADMAPTLPEGVTLDLVRARAELIEGRLRLLLDNAATGLVLVLALLFLFLNARTAFWVALGIPSALLAAIAIMFATGMTLNMISLFALILTLGIIVDDAIVVGEHADYRARTLGEPPLIAAERAAQRMAAPVISSTLTTIIAFSGLLFIGGGMGSMIFDIPATVIIVLVASLVECFLVLPAHMAHALAHRGQQWFDRPSDYVNRQMDRFAAAVLGPLIGWIWRLRYPVLAMTVVAMSWSVSSLISGRVPWQFFSPPEQGSVAGNFAMLPGADRDDTARILRAMQTAIDEVGTRYEDEYGTNPIIHAMALLGGNAGRPLPGAEARDPDLLGAIQVELIDADLRPYSSAEIVRALQDAMPTDPLLETISFRQFGFGPGGDAISVVLSGAEAQRLKDAAEALKQRLGRFAEVSALEDSMPYDKEELQLTLTAQGRALGFTTDSLARDLRQRLAGIEAARFAVGTRSGAIRVEMPARELSGDFLQRMRLRASSGHWVPLSDIVTVTSRAGFSTIRRQNGVRMISVTGDISGDDPARAAEINAQMTGTILPEIAADFGVTFSTTGLAEQERDFMGDAMAGFGLALLGIYMVLAWIFASWARPLVVMAVIPFGLIGAVIGHWSWGLPLSMFSVVGLIGMSGIIINDSIVLISTIDENARDRALRPAVVDAVITRFRPVLLTTLTTVLGLAPLLFERSSQALFLKPTVVTLAYGLAFGMVLVLIVVPAILAVGTDIGRARRALWRGFRKRQPLASMRRGLTLAVALIAAGFALILLPATLLRDLPALGAWPRAATPMQALGLYAVVVALAIALAAILATRASRR